ncbi:MAG: C40 family peptidase [Saprospiraceae bacterium]|nr:C40 family peptidase [Saprospiraceae bacterium]
MIQNSPRSVLLLLLLAFLFAQCGTPGQFGITRTNKPNIPRKKTERPREREEVAVTKKLPKIEPSEVRREMVDYAKQFLGTRYVYGGKSPKGFDCSGFTQYVLKNFDIHISPVSKAQEKEGKKVKIKDVRAGDLVFFRKRGRVFHVALVVDNQDDGLKVIHSTNRGVVLDNISKSDYWKPKLSSAVNVIGE